jgi:hypothetical protein
MTIPLRRSVAAAALAACTARVAVAQSASDGPVLAARHVTSSASFKIFNSHGSVRVVGWDRDSLVVRGTLARPSSFSASGDSSGMKIDVDEPRGDTPPGSSRLVIYLPRHARASVKASNADIDATDVAGWFYTITGNVRISGAASSIEVEAMRGAVTVDARTPWLRVRGGDGPTVIRGAPEDADVSTIAGALDVTTDGVLRGQFASVVGDVRFSGTPAARAIYEFSNHSGAIELRLPADASASLTVSNVMGSIENGFVRVHPVSTTPHTVRITLGRGESQLIVRSFKGAIRLRPAP